MPKLAKVTPAARKAAKQAANATPKKGRRLHVRADLVSGGSLHVRHMADRPDVHPAGDVSVYLDGVSVEEVALADKADKPKWIQIAKQGAFKGHPAGHFELNEKVFTDIISNFRATTDRRVPIDFEHASESAPTDGTIPVAGAPAQGWIVDLKIEGGNLWGLVEWGSLARDYIRSGKYKFFSPAIRFNARDRVTGANVGARLTSGGLTNTPFLDGMKPLVASDSGSRQAGMSQGMAERVVGEVLTTVTLGMGLAHAPIEYMPRIRRILRLDELASADECLVKLQRVQELLEVSGGDPMATPEGVCIADFLYELREFVRASPGTTWDEVFECIEELLGEAGAQPEPESVHDLATMSDDDDDVEDTTTPLTLPAGSVGTIAGSVGMTGTQAEETKTMDPKEIAELNLKLSTAEAKATDAATKLSTAEAKAAELGLSLKDETSKRETAEAELKKLRDEKALREEKDLDDRVLDAFETYKDDKKLTDDDKVAMRIVLKANPENFEKRYPRVGKGEQHLLRNLTDVRETTTPKTTDFVPVMSVRDAAKKMASQRGIPLADAQNIVMKANAGR